MLTAPCGEPLASEPPTGACFPLLDQVSGEQTSMPGPRGLASPTVMLLVPLLLA